MAKSLLRLSTLLGIVATAVTYLLSAAPAQVLLEGGGVERFVLLDLKEPAALINSGLEEGETGWRINLKEAFSVVAAPTQARSGKACLRFDASAKTKFVPSARLTVNGIHQGLYRLRFWVKANDLKAPEASGVRVSFGHPGASATQLRY